jgi:hypothetical protein
MGDIYQIINRYTFQNTIQIILFLYIIIICFLILQKKYSETFPTKLSQNHLNYYQDNYKVTGFKDKITISTKDIHINNCLDHSKVEDTQKKWQLR